MDPMGEDFDPFSALEWSPDFAAAHEQAVEASVASESDPIMTAARSAFVVLKNLQHSNASMKCLLKEKEDLAKQLSACCWEITGAQRSGNKI